MSEMRRLRPPLLAALLLAAMIFAAGARWVAAEAASKRVILSYVPVISNWGPREANGVVLLSYAEGDVRADLVDLPPLGDSERYQLWLENATSREYFPVARFNARPNQTTYLDVELSDPIPDRNWDYVVVTVEPEPDPSPAPEGRVAIVGSIPGTAAEVRVFPAALPKTGYVAGRLNAQAAAMLAANAVVVVALVIRRRLRRSGARASLEDA